MGEGELLDQPTERPRLVRRAQLLALNVFDQRDRDRFVVVELTNDRRNLSQLRKLRSLQAALTRHHFELMREAGYRPHDEGLNEAGGLDRGDKFLEKLGLGLAPGRPKAGANRLDRDRADTLPIE